MKKFMTKSLVMAALAALCLTVTAAAAEIGSGVVDAYDLRLRSQPSTDAETIVYLDNGAKLSVQEDLGDWYKVVSGTYTGYVSAEYVAYTPSPEEEIPDVGTPSETAAEVNANDVNLRSGPSTDYNILGTLDAGEAVTMLTNDDGWCQVAWNGQVGFISSEFVSVNGIAQNYTQGRVTGDGVNVRSQPNTDSAILTRVSTGKVVELISLKDNWYNVVVNGTKGYIRADYVSPYDGAPTTASSAIGSDIVSLALEYLGTPYSYGGASPKGFDCSGFTMYIFSQMGYSLPHSATSQWNNSGEYVERSDLQPGDLVLFCDPSRSNGKACSHVGIYIGDNEFVHASSGSSGKRVRISSLSEDYYSRYYKGAKRVG